MFGIVLVTHGKLAIEFENALTHIVGSVEQIRSICIEAEDDMEHIRKDILKAVKDTDSGDGVVILTDMFGGTPSNLAHSVIEKGRIEVMAGINLPLLVKLASMRKDHSMAKSVKEAAQSGRKYITVASEMLLHK